LSTDFQYFYSSYVFDDLGAFFGALALSFDSDGIKVGHGHGFMEY